ncbi:MAG: HipA domain-containing protein [Fimbriimonadaceae bacterium]|nr:HipA domain-containing protein [Chitinophagales bacterium]
MIRCLYCYQILNKNEIDFHPACSKKMFGKPIPPLLPYTEAQMEELATQIIRSQITVTGVQPKLSLDIAKGKNKNDRERFTIVGLWGGYILKPPTQQYPQLPEVEDLTMHLATLANINTVPHCIIRLQTSNLAYITKRIDRNKEKKIHMEDMCQLTERLTEDKYHGSYEQIAKAISTYSVNPGLDIINFFEQVLFSFLTGNADMHLKNFSLINQPDIGYILAQAYDMVATALVNPADNEELALTLNGRKRKIKKNDFTSAFTAFKLEEKVQQNIFKKFETAIPKWMEFIDISFLSDEMKIQYKELIYKKHEQLSINNN